MHAKSTRGLRRLKRGKKQKKLSQMLMYLQIRRDNYMNIKNSHLERSKSIH